jgi:hypothetical protein
MQYQTLPVPLHIFSHYLVILLYSVNHIASIAHVKALDVAEFFVVWHSGASAV